MITRRRRRSVQMASPKWSLVTLSQCQPAQIAAADDDNDNVAGTGLTFLVILAGYNDVEVKK